jgi:prepilin-type N-terminal cleavage/methylation domain-containing protein
VKKQAKDPSTRLRKHRPGFTLVEMLVAVTLVLLMMSMFAQIFQMAGGSISKQRGLSENDQRARMLQTVIKADLDKRSFRWVYPFAANEDANANESAVTRRQGFFYISENDPSNSLDDVLHFTMLSTMTVRNTDDSPYFGQALNLNANFSVLPNQPDADDAQLFPNNTGQSTAAEVVYFVRNGNLYRRQLLLRDPLSIIASKTQPDTSVGGATGVNLFDPSSANASAYVNQAVNGLGTFWGDYDYSAYFSTAASGATFLGLDALDNGGTSSFQVLANPSRRFGFSPLTLSGTLAGRPKEFGADLSTAVTGNPMRFVGRFTLQECSDQNFQYPQGLTSNSGVPTHPTSYDLVLDNDLPATDPRRGTTGAVAYGMGADDLRQGLRRGEDLLISNVHSFDIQVWDQALGGFINIGTNDATLNGADYHLNNRNGGLSSSYGPRVQENLASGAINAVFDTWHPQISVDYDGDGAAAESPPYRPVYFKPLSITGVSTDIAMWAPQTLYTVNQLVFPSGPPGITFPSPPYPPQTFKKLPFGAPFVYRCVVAGTSAGTGSSTDYLSEPVWPKVDGMTITDGVPGNAVTWEVVDNRKPLKAIKITVRFVDPSTQQMRQLTIVHSLVD